MVDLLFMLERSTLAVSPPDGAVQYNAAYKYFERRLRDAALPKTGWCTKSRLDAFAAALEYVMIGNETQTSAKKF
jgi:hypothetical protein